MARPSEPEPPEVQLLFEGDLDEPVHVPITQEGDSRSGATAPAPEASEAHGPPSFHTVGADPLGAMAETIGDTLDELREQRASARALAIGSAGSKQDRAVENVAQVVQATAVSLDRVIAHLASETAEQAGLRLLDTRPAVEQGMAIYSGSLRLRRPPIRCKVLLRVYPTTSGNLTVLELLPQRHWLPQTNRYLEAGVPAITALTDRIEAANQP